VLNSDNITFDRDTDRFNFRAAAIILDGKRVLLHRAADLDWWLLPGGRVAFGESTGETIKREMREEIGVDVKVERLVWVVETFFHHRGFDFHELGHFWLVRLPPDADVLQKQEFEMEEIEDGGRFVFRWFDLSEVIDLPLVPSFLRDRLNSLPNQTESIVHRDTEEVQT
jgi:8-oxo-dGTP pyrophosphatase MutT (NUDIX family)